MGFGRVALRATAAASVAACLLVLAACSGGGHSSGGGSAGGPPKGGWPQAQNGELVEAMCGLLTDADFTKVKLEPPIPDSQATDAANSLFCSYLLGDAFTMYLQPNAESAKIVFARDVASNLEYLKESDSDFTSDPATGTVTGADDSNVDYDHLGVSGYPQLQVVARRGALVVEISSQIDKNANLDDSRKALSTLAELVLQRVPDLGSEDTGTTHKITYVVTGTGTADINYIEFATGESKKLTGVTLPWKVDDPFAITTAKDLIPLNVNAATKAFDKYVGCQILVDGKEVTNQAPSSGLAFCMSQFTPTSQ